jgi:hypothetical protein
MRGVTDILCGLKDIYYEEHFLADAGECSFCVYEKFERGTLIERK